MFSIQLIVPLTELYFLLKDSERRDSPGRFNPSQNNTEKVDLAWEYYFVDSTAMCTREGRRKEKSQLFSLVILLYT